MIRCREPRQPGFSELVLHPTRRHAGASACEGVLHVPMRRTAGQPHPPLFVYTRKGTWVSRLGVDMISFPQSTITFQIVPVYPLESLVSISFS